MEIVSFPPKLTEEIALLTDIFNQRYKVFINDILMLVIKKYNFMLFFVR